MNVRFKKTNRGEALSCRARSTKYLPLRRGKPPKTSVLRAWLCARKEIAAGMPLIPKQVVDRVASGENALRAFREWHGKTQLDIAHKTKIEQGLHFRPGKRTAKGQRVLRRTSKLRSGHSNLPIPHL